MILYLCTLALICAASWWAGGLELGTKPGKQDRTLAIVALALGVAWFPLGMAARAYADTDGPGWMLAEAFAHRGMWYSFALLGLTLLHRARKQDPRVSGFAASGVALFLLVLTVWKTIPVYVFLPDELQRDEDGVAVQWSQATCAAVSLGNLLERGYGRPSPSERELARLTGTSFEGTTTRGLMRAARKLGISFSPPRNLTTEEVDGLEHMAIFSISTLPTVRHATLLVSKHENDLLFLDPDYGASLATRQWLERVRYGKVLVAKDTQLL